MKKTSIYLSVLFLSTLLFLPILAVAQATPPAVGPNSVDPTQFKLFGTIFNCGPTEGVMCVFKNVLSFILSIAFVIALIFLVIGGFRYITAQGNEEAVEKAKSTISHAVIGMVVILLSWIILAVILNLATTGSPFGTVAG